MSETQIMKAWRDLETQIMKAWRDLETQIMKAWRDYENSKYMNTKALNKYLKLTEWYERGNFNGNIK